MRPFPFHQNGNAARRDPDAIPRVMLLGIEDGNALVHVAGEQYERALTIREPAPDLIAGMDPGDAFRLGVEHGRGGGDG